VGTANHLLGKVQPGDFKKGHGGKAGVGRESATHPAFWRSGGQGKAGRGRKIQREGRPLRGIPD
jgi:hypothetical protein